jgi:hypothetical protein
MLLSTSNQSQIPCLYKSQLAKKTHWFSISTERVRNHELGNALNEANVWAAVIPIPMIVKTPSIEAK